MYAFPFWLPVLRPTPPVHFFSDATSKSAPTLRCYKILTSKYALRQSHVHFFNLSSSKSALHHSQPHNFQKRSEAEVFWTFWLRNVLNILTSKCVSRHIGVLISHPARWLRSRRFSEPTFLTLPGPQNIAKTQCFATFRPFRVHWSSFYWLFLLWLFLFCAFLFSDCSPTTVAASVHKSEVWLLNFVRQYILIHSYTQINNYIY